MVKEVRIDRFGDSSWEIEETMRETYPYLFKIEDHQSTQLRGKTISMVKEVRVDRFGDSSWEIEETMRETYPYLFIASQFSRTKTFLVGENVRTEKNSFRVEVV